MRRQPRDRSAVRLPSVRGKLRRAARPPLPTAIPGSFFLVGYDHGTGSFTLVVDDENHSSYNLGGEIQTIMRYFARLGLSDLGNKAIDLAREFGAAQVVPAQKRVFIERGEPQRGRATLEFNENPVVRLPSIGR